MTDAPDEYPRGVAAWRSYEGDGKYFTIGPNSTGIIFKPEAYLVEGSDCLGRVGFAIDKAFEAPSCDGEYERATREVKITYPCGGAVKEDFAFSTVIPLGDIVLENSPSLGLEVDIRNKKGALYSTGGYGVSYLRVGMDKGPFMTIWNRINSALHQEHLQQWHLREAATPPATLDPWKDTTTTDEGSSYITAPGLRMNQARYWFLASVGHGVSGLAFENKDSLIEVEVSALMKKVGKSLKCDAHALFEIRRDDDQGQWDLNMTLLSVAVLDTTQDRSLSPFKVCVDRLVGRNKQSSVELVNVAMKLGPTLSASRDD